MPPSERLWGAVPLRCQFGRFLLQDNIPPLFSCVFLRVISKGFFFFLFSLLYFSLHRFHPLSGWSYVLFFFLVRFYLTTLNNGPFFPRWSSLFFSPFNLDDPGWAFPMGYSGLSGMMLGSRALVRPPVPPP